MLFYSYFKTLVGKEVCDPSVGPEVDCATTAAAALRQVGSWAGERV
jgi:hypothetical protein